MKRIVFTAAALVASASALEAQNRTPTCATSSNQLQPAYWTADACEKAIDLFNYMAPQLGTAIAGGAPVQGKGGTLGGLGHFSIGVRANVVKGSLPQVTESSVQPQGGGPYQSAYTTKDQYIPMPVVDAALGVFKGIPLGVTRVGGIDLLANVAYAQDFNNENVDVRVDGSKFKFGYGARLGLLQESLVSPGLAVSVIRRDLPVVNVTGDVQSGTTNYSLAVDQLSLKTTSWRAVASKSFLVFGLTAGVGQDEYKSGATATGTASGIAGLGTASSAPTVLTQKLTRTNVFGGVNVNILMVKLAAEIGQVSGGTIETYNTFDTKPDASRLYGSFGMRIGL